MDTPEVERNECGHKVVKLIVGGLPAGRKEFPHMVNEYRNNIKHFDIPCFHKK